MKSIFIDCSLGISGDMLASALLDLGVPHSIFLENLVSLNIDKNYNLGFNEGDSEGIKGIVCTKNGIQFKELSRSLNDIKNLLLDSSLNDYVKKKSIRVFEILAEAESIVHGNEISDVHFHELGSIDSIVDVVNVCSSIDFLNLDNICFSNPLYFIYLLVSSAIPIAEQVFPVPKP